MRPAIVAHRGDAEHHPENTLPALAAAWRRLEFAEFDVQLSADGVPFVIHDTGLERTTRGAGDIRLMMSGQLDGVDAGEPARFGARHAGTPLPRLSAVAGLMARKRVAPESAGTLHVETPTFALTMIAVIVILTVLQFMPALVLGPIADHLTFYGVAAAAR